MWDAVLDARGLSEEVTLEQRPVQARRTLWYPVVRGKLDEVKEYSSTLLNPLPSPRYASCSGWKALLCTYRFYASFDAHLTRKTRNQKKE